MKKIVRMVFGSHMYGLNTPNSDMDYKGIYLPELDDLLLGTAAKNISRSTGDPLSKNTVDDIDDDWYSLSEFLEYAIRGETFALDMLHVNPDLVTVEVDPKYGWIWEVLVSRRDKFYHTNLKSYMGYVKRQAAKYGLKGGRISAMREAIHFLEKVDPIYSLAAVWNDLPENNYAERVQKENPKDGKVSRFYQVNGKMYQDTNTVEYALERITTALTSYGHRALLAEKNEGVDWKAVSHALRAGYQLRSIFENGKIIYPLPERDYVLSVKTGQLDYMSEVSPELERLMEELDVIVTENKPGFPKETDRQAWRHWLLTVYKTVLINPLYGVSGAELS